MERLPTTPDSQGLLTACTRPSTAVPTTVGRGRPGPRDGLGRANHVEDVPCWPASLANGRGAGRLSSSDRCVEAEADVRVVGDSRATSACRHLRAGRVMPVLVEQLRGLP